MEEARALLLELLSHSQVAWCFRRVFGCLLPADPAVFVEQTQRGVDYLSRQLARNAEGHGARRWKLSEAHIDLWRAIAEQLREVVLSTLAPAESREWEAVISSTMMDTGQLATQHERASSIRRLTMLLESSVPRHPAAHRAKYLVSSLDGYNI